MPETTKTFISFFVFGLVNNVLYVIILTAAHDLVPPTTPKSLILLADILPAFLLKVILPLFVNQSINQKTKDLDLEDESPTKPEIGLGINYALRLTIVVILSSLGMFITSLSLPLYITLTGIVFASLSSGLGEVTFLQLSHYYNHDNSNVAIHGWSSGTGAAGLVGSGIILVLTTLIKIPVDYVLIACSVFPFFHFLIFYGLLPPPIMNSSLNGFDSDDVTNLLTPNPQIANQDFNLDMVDCSMSSDIDHLFVDQRQGTKTTGLETIWVKLRSYFFVYMLPLTLVYFTEYTINQGVAPTMLFELEQTPFDTFRDIYVAYGTLYQIGVFISRSSGSFIKFDKLYLMGFLQSVNLIACIFQSIYMFIPNIWIVFLLIFYEGLLGGAAYVNTFMKVSEQVPLQDREFALGCVGISDSFGIVLAAGISLYIEPALCKFQLSTGRDWCTRK